MDEEQFKELKREARDTKLEQTNVKLKTLTEDLTVIRECHMTMENDTRCTKTSIAVVKEKIDSYPLLGRKTLEDLGMVKFDAIGRLNEPNRGIKSVSQLSNGEEALDNIIQQYDKRFHEIGKAKRNG